eukprot:jgi/Psemu1/57358/gm1.57358_g
MPLIRKQMPDTNGKNNQADNEKSSFDGNDNKKNNNKHTGQQRKGRRPNWCAKNKNTPKKKFQGGTANDARQQDRDVASTRPHAAAKLEAIMKRKEEKKTDSRFEECRKDIIDHDNFTKGTDHIPETIDNAYYYYALLQNYQATEKGAKRYGNNRKGSDNNKDRDTKKSGQQAFQQSSNNKGQQVQAIVGEETMEEEFDFKDELDQDCYYTSAYQFTQTTIAPTYIEDMQENANYCLNMKHIGNLSGVGTVWVHRQGIANILSFHGLQEQNDFEGYETKFSESEPELQKELTYNSNQMVFGERIINTEDQEDVPTTQELMVFINNGDIETVEKKKTNFTKRDVLQAEAVRRFQHVASHPSEASNIDGNDNEKYHQRHVYGLNRKRTRRKKDTNVIIAADVLHVNKIPILAAISRNIHYGTITALPSMKLKVMEETLKSNSLPEVEVEVNTASKEEHVPEIE